MPEATLLDRLNLAASVDEADCGVRFLGGSPADFFVSYRDILDRACRAAHALRQAGVARGERVAIVIPTSPEFLDAFFGAMALGAIPVPLYPPLILGRLEEYYERTAAMAASVGATAIVAPAAVRRLLGQVVARCRPAHGVIAAESLSSATPSEPHRGRQQDIAMIQFSSGTTADPKPIGLTHEQIQINLDSFMRVMAPHESLRPLGISWLPLYHDLGLIGFLLGAMCRPGPLVLLRPERFLARPKLWLQAISRFHATISGGPNFGYAYCLGHITDEDMEGCDLSSWQIAVNGAEPVSATVMRQFAERFGRWGFHGTALCPVYGLAEATVGVTVSPLGRPWISRWLDRAALVRGGAVAGKDVEIVSVGRPLPGVEIEIRGSSGALEERQVGSIWVRSPSVPLRYIDGRPLLLHGWLDTGDVGFLWDGDLYVTGRSKDIIILRGRNHAPHDIERVVESIDDIRVGRVVAVGRTGADGETLLVLAEVRRDRPGLEEECRRAVMSAVGVSAEVCLLAPGTLPHTSSGKLRRQEALRRFESGTLAAARKVTPLVVGRVLLHNLKGYRT